MKNKKTSVSQRLCVSLLIWRMIRSVLLAIVTSICFLMFGDKPGYNMLLLAGWIVSLSLLGMSLNQIEKSLS